MRKFNFFINFIILFFLMFTLQIIAQTQINIGKKKIATTPQEYIDSLKSEILESADDTNKVNMLYETATFYKNINPDSGSKYGFIAEKLSKKLNWKKGLSKSYSAIANNFVRKLDYDSAMQYFEKALELNNNLGNKIDIAKSYSDIGMIYFLENNYQNSLEMYNKALELSKNLNHKQNIAAYSICIGNIYNELSDYVKTLEYYHESLKINENISNTIGAALSLINIGEVYINQSEYDRALEYLNRALTAFENNKNLQGVGITLTNIGNLYLKQSKYTLALENFHKSLEIMEGKNIHYGIAINLGYIGEIYYYLSDFDKSLEFHQSALNLHEKIQDKNGIASNLGAIGKIYLTLSQDSIIMVSHNKINLLKNKKKNIDKSIDYTQRAIDILRNTGELHKQSHFLNIISDAYFHNKEFEKSLRFYKEYKQMYDSVFSLSNQKEIANLESKRENEIKDKEILILQTEKKAQQFQSYLLGGGVIVLIGAFAVAFIRFREKKKLSDKLAIQKNEIENQKSLVEEKNEQIVSSITYAATIQHAILPWDSTLKSAFSEILIFYKPKDIVSGDSYWFQELDGIKFLAVIDCTGHGIPGAMLTVIASTALDDAVLGKRISDTGQILTYMNEKVTEVLNQRLVENKIRDGMEVSLIAIHQDKIQFSGAGRPLYMKNGTLEIIKTDKRGIAGQSENDEYQFSSIEIEKSNKMIMYLSSDGFADQMNENSKKFSTKRFVALLDKISEKSISEQSEIIENEFNTHKGNREQIDDVTILGVRV